MSTAMLAVVVVVVVVFNANRPSPTDEEKLGARETERKRVGA